MLPIVLSLLLVVGLLTGIVPLQSHGGQKNLATTGGGATSYSPGELWGGGSPDETCSVCTENALLGAAGGQSLQHSDDVDPLMGDFSTSQTIFDVKAAASDLELTLGYSSEASISEVSAGATSGYFGWGWESTISSSVSPNGTGYVVNQPNGSEVSFNAATSDGCPNNDYQDFQKYTVANSYLPWCASPRLNAQLGTYGGLGYAVDEGSGSVAGYSWTGQLAFMGDRADPGAEDFTYNVTPGTTDCPAGSGVVSCFLEQAMGTASGTDGRVMSAEINSGGHVIYAVDPMLDNLYQFNYDGSGDLTSIYEPDGGTGLGEWTYGYTTSAASPYNHEIGSIGNPDWNATGTPSYQTYGNETIGYSTGMVDYTQDDGELTQYTYAFNNCAVPVTPPATNPCLQPTANQVTTVNYPDGENDVDAYQGGVIVADSFGPSAILQGPGDQNWSFSWLYPGGVDSDSTETVTLPDGGTAKIVTDSVGDVNQYTDPNGNVTNSMYNDAGGNNLHELCWSAAPGVSVPSNASCSNPPTGSTHYTYDAYGDELTETDPVGNTTYNGYYSNGMLCWTAEATVGNGSPCTGTTPAGPAPTGSTAYMYYLGNVSEVVKGYWTSTAEATQTAYNNDSEPTYTVPPDGAAAGAFGSNPYETAYSYYQGFNLVRQVTQPTYSSTSPLSGGRVTTYTYDPSGNVLTESDPAGVTSNAYGYLGRVCWTLRSTGASTNACASAPTGSTAYTYGNHTDSPTLVEDPNGNTTTNTYGNDQYPNKATEVRDPLGTEITYNTYNTFGEQCVSGPIASGSCPTTSSGAPTGDTSNITNDEGQLTAEVDPSGNVTSFAYANAAYPTKPTTVATPTATTQYWYDADGRTLWAEDAEGNYETTGYDADGRECYQDPALAFSSCSPGPSATAGLSTYQYNVDDQRSSMVDYTSSTASTTSAYSYDPDGNLVSASDDNGRTVRYQYDDAAEVNCVAYPNSTTGCGGTPSLANEIVNRTYDGAGRLASITDWQGNATTYGGYNARSEVGSITYPTTTPETMNYGYDAEGNLKSANLSGSGASTTNTWGYNPDEQVASTSQLGGQFTSSTDVYNSYKQVTTASNPASSGTTYSSVSDSYTVAPDGQLTADKPAGASQINYGYNSKEELTSVSNPNIGSTPDTSLGYTPDGQRCWEVASSSVQSGTCSAPPSGATSLEWNALGQLCASGGTASSGSSCSSPPSGASTYSYSGDGLRMTEATPTAGAFAFTWDTVDGGTDPLAIDDGQSDFIYGPTLFGGTAPVEQVSATTGTVTYLTTIPSGVQDVLNSGGNVQEESAYTTYGTRVPESTQTPGTAPTAFGFQGSYTDPSGLVYLINRYYDPSTDQFLSVDPDVASTLQPFTYTGGDPLNSTDPLGDRSCGRNRRCPPPIQKRTPVRRPVPGRPAKRPQPKSWRPLLARIHPADAVGPGLAVASSTAKAASGITDTAGSAHLSGSQAQDDAALSDGLGGASQMLGAIGVGYTTVSDLHNGDSIGYTAANVGGGMLGAMGGAAAASAACGAPEDGVGVACGVADIAFPSAGAYIGGQAAPSFFNKLGSALSGAWAGG